MIIPAVLTRSAPILIVAWIAALAQATPQQGTESSLDLNTITNAVDKHYDGLHSLKADFEEVYRAEGVERTEAGTLWLERGGKMRWQYSQPQQKLFMSDGHDAYFYVPGDNEAQKSSLKQLDDLRSPLRYLLGKTKLRKEFDQLTATSKADGTLLLTGIPRGTDQGVTSVQLEIERGDTISAITINNTDGPVTEFRFHNVVENPPANESLFEFHPPPGVRVVDSGEIVNQ